MSMQPRRVHRGVYIQTGRGIGSIFAGLFRALRPLLTGGAKIAVKSGKQVLQNKAVQQALSEAGSEALKSGINLIKNTGKNASTPKKKATGRAAPPVVEPDTDTGHAHSVIPVPTIRPLKRVHRRTANVKARAAPAKKGGKKKKRGATIFEN